MGFISLFGSAIRATILYQYLEYHIAGGSSCHNSVRLPEFSVPSFAGGNEGIRTGVKSAAMYEVKDLYGLHSSSSQTPWPFIHEEITGPALVS